MFHLEIHLIGQEQLDIETHNTALNLVKKMTMWTSWISYKLQSCAMGRFVYCHSIINWCLFVLPTVANAIKIVLDLLRLNSISGCSGLCCLCSEREMEGVREHSNTHEIAAGSIFWYNLVWWFECICSKAITNLRIRLTWYADRNGGAWEGKTREEDCCS